MVLKVFKFERIWYLFDLKFEFERYLAVYRGKNGIYRYHYPAVKT
jgi:hypothetical protein